MSKQRGIVEANAMRPAIRMAAASAVVLVLAVATMTRTDPDLWGHTRMGLDTLETFELPERDPYSFTQDRSRVHHEWLSELQMGIAYALAGSTGLALLKGALTFAAIVLVWASLRRIDLSARTGIMGVAVVGAAGVAMTLRPQLWTLLCLLILCRTLVDTRSSTRRWLPVLFVFWANLHGGWIVGYGILAAWAAATVWTNRSEIRPWAVTLTLCALATLCTPYGWDLSDFMLRTVRITRPNIEDWQPLWRLPPTKWVPWLAVVSAAVWAVRRPWAFRLPAFAASMILAYASLRIARVLPLFVASAAVLLAPAFALRWPNRNAQIVGSRHETFAAAILVLVALTASAWTASASLRCIAIEDTPAMPDRPAAQWLHGAGSGRLVTFFNWGEYALWHFGPRLQVSMDGRREEIYSDQRLAEHDGILFGTVLGFETLDRWRAEYVWLPASSRATKQWLAEHGYRIEVDTPRSFIAVRDDLPRLPEPSSPPAEACFPG